MAIGNTSLMLLSINISHNCVNKHVSSQYVDKLLYLQKLHCPMFIIPAHCHQGVVLLQGPGVHNGFHIQLQSCSI